MTKIDYKLLQPEDHDSFQLIANWYLDEWKIPRDKTIQKLTEITSGNSQFQMIMTVDDIPVSTAGVYNHVGLLDKEPGLKIYKNWLALVYTVPDKRHIGYGALICHQVQSQAKTIGINTLYLFTDTAENLYIRLGWKVIERLAMDGRNIAVMKMKLQNEN